LRGIKRSQEAEERGDLGEEGDSVPKRKAERDWEGMEGEKRGRMKSEGVQGNSGMEELERGKKRPADESGNEDVMAEVIQWVCEVVAEMGTEEDCGESREARRRRREGIWVKKGIRCLRGKPRGIGKVWKERRGDE
jgi:hypothetical protein